MVGNEARHPHQQWHALSRGHLASPAALCLASCPLQQMLKQIMFGGGTFSEKMVQVGKRCFDIAQYVCLAHCLQAYGLVSGISMWPASSAALACLPAWQLHSLKPSDQPPSAHPLCNHRCRYP